MSLAIETRGLTKRYGALAAVDQLGLQVEAGSVFGFVGPNGAGKTTTMRILATLLRPSGGEAWVAGHSVRSEEQEVRRAIGYMPDSFGVYDDMHVWEYLDFFAACYGMPAARRRPLVDELLELVDLAHRRDDDVNALSRGMKQRLCLARALAHDPSVLILDEPASGLDPRARVEMREVLRELRAMGKTILVSSHILSEVEEVCTHIGIIEKGSLVAAGSLTEIQRRVQRHRSVRIGLVERLAAARSWLAAQAEVSAVEDTDGRTPEAAPADTPMAPEGDPGADGQGGELRVAITGDDRKLADLLTRLVGAGFAVVRFQEERDDLEDVFLRLTTGAVS